MSKRFIVFGALALAVLLAVGTVANTGTDPASVSIDGSIGMSQALEHSCIAVWVPLGGNLALTGVTWYNNDGTVAFPEVLVQGGSACDATTLEDAMSVASNVVGNSSGWSELTFPKPITSDTEGIYVIFRVPSGSVAVADGAGGGPAIGYTRSAAGCSGWLSADGEEWMQIHPSFRLAVLPSVAKAAPGMAVKCNSFASSRTGDPEADSVEAPESDLKPEVVVKVTGLEPASPNPFNPRTTLNFSLMQAEAVDLAIYSVRGELVKQLVSEHREQGLHTVVWDGTDRGGHGVSSGVYLARFVAGSVSMTQRLVLMR
jgi:hypothetical protein